jgi:hypothetical protein
MTKAVNQERFEHLRSLTPLEAIRAMLEGDFGIGDEPAIAEAIRKDKRIKLSNDEVIDLLRQALQEDDCNAQKCLDKLLMGS